MLFDWLVDNPKNPASSRVTLFSRALDAWWDDPEVTTPLLKFVAEFVHNKAQRITFDQTSPNGILLFREASTILVTFGTRILQKTQFRDVYVEKYKGIGICLQMFSHSLHGNYTNFGVFELYSDSSLSKSMALALQMCLAIPLQELNAYLKVVIGSGGLAPYKFEGQHHAQQSIEQWVWLPSTALLPQGGGVDCHSLWRRRLWGWRRICILPTWDGADTRCELFSGPATAHCEWRVRVRQNLPEVSFRAKDGTHWANLTDFWQLGPVLQRCQRISCDLPVLRRF